MTQLVRLLRDPTVGRGVLEGQLHDVAGCYIARESLIHHLFAPAHIARAARLLWQLPLSVPDDVMLWLFYEGEAGRLQHALRLQLVAKAWGIVRASPSYLRRELALDVDIDEPLTIFIRAGEFAYTPADAAAAKPDHPFDAINDVHVDRLQALSDVASELSRVLCRAEKLPASARIRMRKLLTALFPASVIAYFVRAKMSVWHSRYEYDDLSRARLYELVDLFPGVYRAVAGCTCEFCFN